MIQAKNDKHVEQLVSGHNKIVLDFSATWCGPCKAMAPALVKLESKFPGVTFVNVDVAKCPESADQFDVKTIPMLAILSHGRMVGGIGGFHPATLEQKLAQLLR